MSLIIMNKKVREFEMPTPTTQFSGHFKLEVINPSTGKVKRSLEFDNLILNNGLNRFSSTSLSNTAAFDRICIGTGTSIPDVDQVSLSNFSTSVISVQGSTLQSDTVSIVGTEYCISSSRVRFATGTLNGNYSEIGVGWSNTQLFSRALILDGNGQPTTITVLSDEALDVTYSLRSYIPTTDLVTTVNITGVGTDIPLYVRPAIVKTGNNYLNTSNQVSYRPWTSVSSGGWSLSSPTSPGLITSAGSFLYLTTSAGSFPSATPSVYYSPTTATSLQSITSTSYTAAGSISSVNDITRSATAYVNGNYYKDASVISGLNAFNSTYRHFVVGFHGMGVYQYLLDTPITKTSSQILTLNFRCSWARRTI